MEPSWFLSWPRGGHSLLCSCVNRGTVTSKGKAFKVDQSHSGRVVQKKGTQQHLDDNNEFVPEHVSGRWDDR